MNPAKDLNPEQSKVVNLTEGPVLVLAGPGTGKTQLLSARTANIIKNKKAAPENILILTFTNAAAKAMKERLAALIGEEGFKIEVSTYHSFARNYIILDSEEAINYIGERIQITDVEKTRAIEYILDTTKGLEPLRPFGAPYAYRWEIEKKISELKNEGVSPHEFGEIAAKAAPDGIFIEERHLPRLAALAKIYTAYEELKTGKNSAVFDQRGRFDYDDIILIATEALKKEKTLRERYQRQFTYIMVDEFQDSNGAQLELLLNLVNPDRPNICCVGDDDQSIYRFQGANIGNFRLLKEKFKGIKVLTLKANYRSTSDIINLSSRIISNIPRDERMEDKTLSPNSPNSPKMDYANKSVELYEFSTMQEELLFIIKKIEEMERAVTYNNIAILVRKRDDILKVIDAFLAAGIPYSTDGKEDISHEKRVRQLLDALEMAHIDINGKGDRGEEDLALFKVLSSDYLEIPIQDVMTFIAEFRKEKGESLLAKLTAAKEPVFKKAVSAITGLLKDARTRPIHAMLMQYIHESGMYKFILKDYDKNRTLGMRDLRAVTSFVNIVKSSDRSKPGIGLDEFMEEIKTKKEHGIPLQGELVTLLQDGVRIYTAHGSKGQEFNTVFIPFCIQDKNWPLKPKSDKLPLPSEVYKAKGRPENKERLKSLMISDETRLFYVASSRAKANLIFTASPSDNNIISSYLSRAGIVPKDAKYPEDKVLLALLNTNYEDLLSKIKTNKAIAALIEEIVLTPTKLNNYIKCKRKFFYDDVLKLPGRKRQGLIFGNCAHKALEETYRRFKEEGKFPGFVFFEEAFKRELKFQGADKAMENRCLDKLDILKDWLEKAKRNPVTPLDLEKRISINIGDGIFFVGKYDKVEMEDEKAGLVRVIDYKTGKPDKHLKDILNFSGELEGDERHDYIRQLVAYKMLFEGDKTGPARYKVSHGVLAFLEPVDADWPRYKLKKGEFRNAKIAITDKMVSDLETTVKKVWREIRAMHFEKFPERDNSLCGACDFDTICWPTK
ncbi:MAG: ATP-dependent DNA helicase [Candidatus Omnitrophica bacterium]|nr:ATP-dependent DNA helicase [Candidatus Omnitrophota bacterium]